MLSFDVPTHNIALFFSGTWYFRTGFPVSLVYQCSLALSCKHYEYSQHRAFFIRSGKSKNSIKLNMPPRVRSWWEFGQPAVRIQATLGSSSQRARAFATKLFPAQCKHCLLYTSPSPRDQRGSRMPSSA